LRGEDELVWVLVMTETDLLWIFAITMFITLIWVIFFWDR
jgi:hypothetical protein